MAYRDEHEALLARLEASEQRLLVAENELAEVKRRLEEPLVLQPSSAPPSSRRIGFPPEAPHAVQYGRMAAALGGTVLSLVGIASLLWNLPAAEGIGDLAATLAAAIAFCLAPGGLLLYVSARRPPRRARVEDVVDVPRARITLQPQVEVSDDREDDEISQEKEEKRRFS